MAFKIDKIAIGDSFPPFVIAELSGNHNQSLERAFQIIDAAADSGAHALKIQTYTPDTMTLNLSEGDFFISDPKSLWKGSSLYDLYKVAYTPWEWHKPIFDHCHKRGLICFSTPFDSTSVDFLETLNVPCYKVASFENADIPLLKKIGKTGKPVIMSTGMASLAELEESIATLRKEGTKDIVLLKCTSSYPATPEGSNLQTIPHLKKMFNTQVGLSDHTLGIGVSIASVALGATVIEKHFTLSRADGGVDSAFSMEPHEMKLLVEETRKAWQALGHISYGVSEQEKKSMVFRRSLYIAEDMKKGDILNEKNMRSIRPGKGLAPKYYEVLLGKKVNCELKKGTPISFNLIG